MKNWINEWSGKALLCVLLLLLSMTALAAANNGKTLPAQATYLANEGVMIVSGDSKILFDPFFHNDYGHYQKVPESIRQAIFSGTAPYDDIDAIFISHAHEDHFSALDMNRFLTAQNKAHLFAPQQAVTQLAGVVTDKALMKRVTAVAMGYGDKPWSRAFGGLLIEAVRIPHAGGPGRLGVENMVFRVSLDAGVIIMHMGDADPNDKHFAPYASYWQQKVTATAFVPYWFFSSPQGRKILYQRINAKHHIGVHVPLKVPKALMASGLDYFSKPGETRHIGKADKK